MPDPRDFIEEVISGAAGRQNAGILSGMDAAAQNARERLGASARSRSMTFTKWATTSHFVADREPVNLTLWPHLKALYDAVPIDCTDLDICVMKAAQGGASIWAMLVLLYVALRERCQLGYFLPTRDHAMVFSNERFLRLCRDNEAIYSALGDIDHQTRASGVDGKVKGGAVDEGSKSIRRIGRSVVYFTYMGGVVTTESLPLDGIVFDEVQEMLLREVEKTEERLSASMLKLKLRVSTANFAGADIAYYFERSTQETWTTDCKCDGGVVLADEWDPEHGPLCIAEHNAITYWRCPHCGTQVDPKKGRYVAMNPGHPRRGFHFPQFVSPRQTAASILLKWRERVDTKNFYNRILGRPFTDPKTQPIGEQHLAAAQDSSLDWGPLRDNQADGRGEGGSVVMGIDQMGHDNHVVIACRWYDRMRVLHAEIVRSGDPWERCAQLMRQYRVRICAVEALPNFNEAHRFARAFDGRVWVVNYADLIDQMVTWGDRPRDKVSIRKTDDEARGRYVATCDQYRMMSWALGQWTTFRVATPDARALVQHIRGEGGIDVPTAIWRDIFWLHMQRVALVTEEVQGRETERRLRRCVKKIGIDPHFAYTWMLLCVAWVRIFGTEQLLSVDPLPTEYDRTANMPKALSETEKGYAAQINERIDMADEGGPRRRKDAEIPHYLRVANPTPEQELSTCGTCASFDPRTGACTTRDFTVRAALPACDYYTPAPLPEDRW
jgi:hypothetical protein